MFKYTILNICLIVFLVCANETTTEAEQVSSEYAYSQKEDYIARTKEEVNHLQKDLSELEMKSKKITGNAKEEIKIKIKTVKTSIDKLHIEIENLKSAQEGNWVETKRNFNESIEKVKSTIEKSRKWLSEKIAP
jgi:septal ring factor EnvC (AmiA/AmiB activator)